MTTVDYSRPVLVGTVAELDDEDLELIAGPATLARGLMYAKRRHVLSIMPTLGGARLDGQVQGSQGRSYRTTVRLIPDDETAVAYWQSTCTCPMAGNCKHAVALVATARAQVADRSTGGSGPRRVAALPSWKDVLTGLTADPQAARLDQSTPVGLLLEIVPGSGRPRIRLRPVSRGRTGWVKNAVSWGNVEHAYAHRTNLDPEQRRVLADIAQTYQRRHRKYYLTQNDRIHLDELGAAWWSTLREASRHGIPLLLEPRQGAEVHLVEEPARFALDVCRDEPDGDAHLAPVVSYPDEARLGAGVRVSFIGEPPTGAYAERDDGDLVLLRFDPPLDRAQAGFLTLGSVPIPAADLPTFLRHHVPLLRERVTLLSSDESVAFPEVSPPRLALTVTHQRGHRVRLLWSCDYVVGDDVVPVFPGSPGPVRVPRDHDAEAQLLVGPEVLDKVAGLRISLGGRPRLVPDTTLTGLRMLTFLDDVLPELEADDAVDVTVQGEAVDYEEADEAPLIRLSVVETSATAKAPGQTDWFDLGVDVSVGGEAVPLAALLTALTHGDDHVILDSGTWFRTDQPELQDLRRLLEEARSIQDDPNAPLRLTPYQADLWAELVELGVVDEQSERWARTVKALGGLEGIPAPSPPAALRATLRPYQLEGFHWLTFLRRAGLGGILADDMGLGKTIQTLAMVLEARNVEPGAAPFLVVAPTSVLSTWGGEAAKFCPDLRVTTLGATSRKRGTSVTDEVGGFDLVLTSYAVFRLDQEAFRAQGWSALILDEAQFAKNHQSQVHQCARRLAAPVKLAITGTPMENNLMELWSLLSIVAPGLFPSPRRFQELYRRPIESGLEPERLAILRRRVRPVMLRRTKETVATDLPPKQEQTIAVTLSPRHRRIYDTHLQRERQKLLGLLEDADRNRIAIFRSLTLLRQLSLDPALVDESHAGVGSAKVDAFLELLQPVVDEGHKALVFSQFTGFLATVRARLDGAGIAHEYLDGRTRNRQQAIERFKSGDAPAFLISLKAGGFGLNLTEADYVFLLDPWWNPAAEAQAIDRTHRIGQDKHVMVYRLVSTETIEEKVVALQQRKRALFSQVVDEGALTSGTITADDIRGLLTAD
jgi:superfamily II DNA or RNA helicase